MRYARFRKQNWNRKMFNEQSSCVAVIRNGGIVPIPLLRLDSPRSPTNETTTISHSHLVLHGLFCYLLLGTEILKFIITWSSAWNWNSQVFRKYLDMACTTWLQPSLHANARRGMTWNRLPSIKVHIEITSTHRYGCRCYLRSRFFSLRSFQ